MPVFLYNYSDRTMHGIYKAVSEGDIEINPRGEQHGCMTVCHRYSLVVSQSVRASWHKGLIVYLQDGPHFPTSALNTLHKFVLRFTINVRP